MKKYRVEMLSVSQLDGIKITFDYTSNSAFLVRKYQPFSINYIIGVLIADKLNYKRLCQSTRTLLVNE